MTTEHGEQWRGLMALEVVGQLDPQDRTALQAHLDGCAACRDERAELLPLAGVLGAADPRHTGALGERSDDAASVPAHLRDAVLTRLHAEARRDVRQRRARSGLLSGVAAAVVAAAVLVGLQPWGGPAGRTYALAGPAGVQASVTLVAESWGTRLHIEETGQPGGQVLTVAMRSRAGHWWAVGSYRTVAGRTVRVDLACAVPPSQVYGVYVRDAQGHTVLRSERA